MKVKALKRVTAHLRLMSRYRPKTQLMVQPDNHIQTPPVRESYALKDGSLSAVHFGRRANPLKLVLLHANGFNAMSYRQVLEPLGVHALAIDLRGHGLSTLPADPDRLSTWRTFRDAAFSKTCMRA